MDFRPLKKTLIGLGICVALYGCSKEESVEDKRLQVQAHLELADVYKKQGQFRASVIETQNAYDLMPTDVDVLSFIAELDIEIGDLGQAISHLDEALKIVPDSSRLKLLKAEALLTLNNVADTQVVLDGLQVGPELQDRKGWLEGSMQAAAGNIGAAKATLNGIITNNPQHVPSLISLAKIAFIEGDSAQAKTYTEQAVATGATEDEDLLMWRGQLAMLQENYPEAETAFKGALDIMGNYDIMTAKKLATLQSVMIPLQKQQKDAEALKYSQIIASSPQGAFTNSYSKAVTLFQQGSLKEAESELEALLKNAPNHPGSNILLGLSKFSEGKFSEAEQLLSQYVDSANASPQLIGTLATTHLQTGHPEKALTVLQDALTASPDNIDILAMIGSIQGGMKNFDSAVTTLNKALTLSPNSAKLLMTLANVHVQAGKPDEAISQLQEVVKLEPALTQPKSQLLGLLVSQKKTDLAKSTVAEWLKQDAASVDNNMLAGMLSVELSDFAKSKEYFKAVQVKEPTHVQAQLYLARAEIGEKNYPVATEILNGILAKAPGNPDAISGILAIGDFTKNPQASIERIVQLINQNPKEFAGSLLLGQYYVVNGDLANALTYSEKSYGISQNQYTQSLYLEVLNQSAVQALQAKDNAQAGSLLEKALGVQSTDIRANSLQVAMAATTGNFKEAHDKVEYIRGLQPDSGYSHELEGDLLVAEKKVPEAASAYQTAWSKGPSASVGVKLYQLLKAQNLAADATKFLGEWLAVDSSGATPNLLTAMELQASKKDAESISYYEKVRAVDENNMIMLNNLAWLYQDTKPSLALELSAKAANLAPKSADVLDTYGWIVYKQGDAKKAREILQVGLQIDPNSESLKEHLQQIK
jgi:cellulose synthase operon protein C